MKPLHDPLSILERHEAEFEAWRASLVGGRTAHQEAVAREMRANGVPLREVARALGCSIPNAHRRSLGRWQANTTPLKAGIQRRVRAMHADGIALEDIARVCGITVHAAKALALPRRKKARR